MPHAIRLKVRQVEALKINLRPGGKLEEQHIDSISKAVRVGVDLLLEEHGCLEDGVPPEGPTQASLADATEAAT